MPSLQSTVVPPGAGFPVVVVGPAAGVLTVTVVDGRVIDVLVVVGGGALLLVVVATVACPSPQPPVRTTSGAKAMTARRRTTVIPGVCRWADRHPWSAPHRAPPPGTYSGRQRLSLPPAMGAQTRAIP